MTIFRPVEDVDFSGYTLFIPSVSVGNVGQLCVDLLITSIPCTHVGYIWHDAIIPLVGNDPYSEHSNKLAVGAEVYCSKEKKVVIIQIRSAPLKELKNDFFNQLVLWTKDCNISQVVILTGSLQHERIDCQINGSPFRYVACPKTIEKHEIFNKNSKWLPLEMRHFPASPESSNSNRSPGRCVIPGGGYSKRLYDSLVKAGIPCAVIIKFTGEGDNIPDAVFLTEHLVNWLPLISFRQGAVNSIQCVYPPSWRLLFGNGPPDGLY